MLATGRYKAGTTAPITADFVDNSGLPAAPVTPTVRIRRRSDNKWWDGDSFEVALTDIAMTEVDAANLLGRVKYDFAIPAGQQGQVYDVHIQATGVLNTPQRGLILAVAKDESDITNLVGTRTITITTKAGGTIVPLTKISVKDSAGTVLLGVAEADANGVASFTLSDGTYKVDLFKPGEATWAQQTLVVDGDETVIYDGTRISVPASGVVGLCNCYIYTNETANANDFEFVLLMPPKSASGVLIDAGESKATVVGDHLEILLVRKATYQISSRKYGVRHVLTIPDNAGPFDIVATLGVAL